MRRLLLLPELLLILSITPASAVMIAGGFGNTEAPADDPGFANVGAVNNASAVYLGNRWVISAAHTKTAPGAPVIFDSVTYTVTGPVIRLNNGEAPGMTPEADLILFQINTDPGLPAVRISPVPAPAGAELILIGNGRDRVTDLSYWRVTTQLGPGNDTWTEVGAGDNPNAAGFKASGAVTGDKRWGTNTLLQNGLNVTSDGFGTVRSLVTVFDSGSPNEAQATVGDSGGAAFYQNGGEWELAGVMFGVNNVINPYDNVPAGATVFGHAVTFAADLSFYRDQITAITAVPEPGAAGLLLAAAASTLLTHRRRKAGC